MLDTGLGCLCRGCLSPQSLKRKPSPGSSPGRRPIFIQAMSVLQSWHRRWRGCVIGQAGFGSPYSLSHRPKQSNLRPYRIQLSRNPLCNCGRRDLSKLFRQDNTPIQGALWRERSQCAALSRDCRAHGLDRSKPERRHKAKSAVSCAGFPTSLRTGMLGAPPPTLRNRRCTHPSHIRQAGAKTTLRAPKSVLQFFRLGQWSKRSTKSLTCCPQGRCGAYR